MLRLLDRGPDAVPRAPRPARRRLVRRVLAAGLAVVLALTAWIVVPAVTSPGNDDLQARLAESLRDHGLGFVVTGLEALQYRISPPREHGSLSPAAARALAAESSSSAPATAGSPAPSGAATPGTPSSGTSTSGPPIVGSPRVGLHVPLPPIASPGLPGEGVFTPRVLVRGQPALQVALVRPDSDHTSYLAGVAWMSSTLLRFVQHPGATDPGRLSLWSQPPTIPAAARPGLVATFNSGFKIADSRGAFYADGHTVGHFRKGAASLVVFDDGHLDIGAWGREVAMTPRVRSVRQNLDPLIDAGALTSAVDDDAQATWGATIGAAAYVWRSGVGVTAAGDVVFVAGDALSARTLAVLLQRAGAVRAMELDINPSWVSFMWYSASPGGGAPKPSKLVDFARPADRYFTTNNRDFFAVYAR